MFNPKSPLQAAAIFLAGVGVSSCTLTNNAYHMSSCLLALTLCCLLSGDSVYNPGHPQVQQGKATRKDGAVQRLSYRYHYECRTAALNEKPMTPQQTEALRQFVNEKKHEAASGFCHASCCHDATAAVSSDSLCAAANQLKQMGRD